MKFVIGWLVLLTVPQNDVTRDSCDVIEIHHVYDSSSRVDSFGKFKVEVKHRATYLLFWDWVPHENDWVCICWRRWAEDYPMRRGGVWFVHFVDKGGTFREVQAICFRETWSDFDAEVVNRRKYENRYRRELIKETMRGRFHSD